jgi:glycosyltransferase involved in cell wall biosynthesis
MVKFAIGIPTINRADLLVPSLMKYVKDFNDVEIHIVDNGNQDLQKYEEFSNVFIHIQKKNLGVAGSWNFLCDIIYHEHDWALLLNDDIYLGYNSHVINKVIDDNNTFGLIQSHLNFSVILLHKEFYKYVGRFDDEFYPAYYEDSDFLYRMKLLGCYQAVDAKLNPIDARVSQTYEKAPEFVNDSMKYNRQRYIDKWGDIPLLEKFKIPFNGKNY